jgi:F-type H+-transporting ATPase subunit b
MEAIGRLGIEPVLLIAQVVNFAIIAFVVQRFLLRPVLAGLKARREKIAAGLEDAERGRQALENAEGERQRVLAAAHEEASAILDNARDGAERIRVEAVSGARVEADRLLADARSVLAAERDLAEREVRDLSVDLSGKILETVVRDLFSEEEKRLVVARGLERIARLGAS